MSQSRCAYIYAAGDKGVLSGKYKIGDRCVAYCRNVEKLSGFCYGHFKKWNMANNPEVNAAAGRLQSESLRARKKKAVEKNKEIVENANEVLNDIDKEILAVLGKTETCDLVYEYSLARAHNINPQTEKYAEKFAFAMWLNTPESKRTPKTIEEAAEILGVAIVTLALWRRSPELVRIFNSKAKQSFMGTLPWVHQKLLKRVYDGSEKAMDVSIKIIKEYESESGQNSKPLPTSPEMLNEAMKINEGSDVSRLTGVANQVKKVVNYNAMLNGNVKPNDVTN